MDWDIQLTPPRNNPTTTSHIHATLTLLPNITSLKLRSPNTTLLRTFNISSLLSLPSAINSKPQFPHLTNLQLKVKLKTASYPSFLYGSGGVMAEAQKRGDEYHAIQEARKIRGAVEKLVRKEGEERWIDVVGPAILVVGWETERGKVLGEVEE
jgi:hypothetical protein